MRQPEANTLLWNGPVGAVETSEATNLLAATLEHGELAPVVEMPGTHASIIKGAAAVLRAYNDAEDMPGLTLEGADPKELPKPKDIIKYLEQNQADVASIVTAIPWLTTELETNKRTPQSQRKFMRRFSIPRLQDLQGGGGQVEQLRGVMYQLIKKRYDNADSGVLMVDPDFPGQRGNEILPPTPLLWNMAITIAGNFKTRTMPTPALAAALASGFIQSWEATPLTMRDNYPVELHDLWESLERAHISNKADMRTQMREVERRYSDLPHDAQVIAQEKARMQRLYDQLGKVALGKSIIEHMNAQHLLYLENVTDNEDEIQRRQHYTEIKLAVSAEKYESAIAYQHAVTQDVDTLHHQAEQALKHESITELTDAIMALNEQRNIDEPGARAALAAVWPDALDVILRALAPNRDEIAGGLAPTSQAAFIHLLNPNTMGRNHERVRITSELQRAVGWAASRHFNKRPMQPAGQGKERIDYTEDTLTEPGRQLLRAGYLYDIMRKGMPYSTLTPRQVELQARLIAERTNNLSALYEKAEASHDDLPGDFKKFLGNVQRLVQRAKSGRFGRLLNRTRYLGAQINKAASNYGNPGQ